MENFTFCAELLSMLLRWIESFSKTTEEKKSKSNLQELLQEIFLENLWEDSLALTLYTISPG